MTPPASNATLQLHGEAIGSPDQEEFLPPFAERAEIMLHRVFRGFQHLQKVRRSRAYFTCEFIGDASTFDSDILTRIVIAAHVYCLRVEVRGGKMGRLNLLVSERQRTGNSLERHPTLAEAINAFTTQP